MSEHSIKAKVPARSAKTVRRNAKKAAKSARANAKITKTSRRRGQEQSRPTRVSVTAARTEVSSRAKRPALSPAATASSVTTMSLSVHVERSVSPVPAHKYHLGEIVYYTSPSFGRAAARGAYTIVKLLPSESDDYQYRIKSNSEAFERVAKESQLDKA